MFRVTLLLPLAVLTYCQPDETLTGHGAKGRTWVLQDIDGLAFTETAEFRFPRHGVLEGHGPCNLFRGSIIVPYPWFHLETFEKGHASCPKDAAEARLMDSLAAVTLVEIAGGTMLLTNDDSSRILRLTAE